MCSTDLNDLCANFIEANGIKAVAKDGLNLTDNLVIGRQDVQTAYDMGRRLDGPEVEGIALACTNWKTMDIIDRLERDIGKPVVSTSQVTVWAALRAIGYDQPVHGYGRLLREHLTPQRAAA